MRIRSVTFCNPEKWTFKNKIFANFDEAAKLWPNISLVVEFKRWWVLKSKIFGQESTYSRENLFKKSVAKLWFIKMCQNCTFKVNFQCQKSTEFSQKKHRLRPNILAKRLGGRSLSRSFSLIGFGFGHLIFWPIYLA